MASFLHQLKVLLWKNWLGIYRQPLWSVVLIFWPVIIFIILAITRAKFTPTQAPNCYFAPRNLQSTGMIPFLQNFLCETDTKCSNRPFTSNTDLSTRLEKRSVDSGGDGSISQMRSSNDPLEALWDRAAGENFGNILNNIEVVKTAVEELSSGDAKGAFCTAITLLSTTQQSTFQVFCSSNQTLTSFALHALFSQASGSDTLTRIYKILTKVQHVQNNEAIWNILLMLPEWIKNPSLIFEDLNHFFSKVSPEIADLQSCITYLVKTANQVQNQSSPNNQRGILEIVLDLSTGNDMKSCISFFQEVSCGSSPCWLSVGNTFEKIYRLMSSLTDVTSSDVCEFNGLNITCNGTINLNMVFQSVLTVVNETSRNPSAVIIRILGQILTSFQESGLQNVFIQSVQSEIRSLSSEEQKSLQNFLSMVASAIKETISDTALQPPSYNNNLVFNIVENIMKNFAMEGLGGSKNITKLIFSLVPDILQIAQNWNNVSLATAFPQNGYNEAVKELEGLLNNLLSQNSADKNLYYKYSTTILKAFAAFFAKGEKDQVMQTIQYLLNLSNDTINVSAMVNTLENFYDLLNLNKTVDLNLLELYIKQLFSFISSSQMNQTFSDFSFLFNMSQKLFSLQTSEISHAALELLPFFYPSNLYNISKSSDSLVPTLLNVLSKNIPHDQQLAIRNFTDTILSFMELIVKCSNDSAACDSAVSGFEVLTINVVNVINNMGNGTLNLEISNETLMELETLTDLQISLINNLVSLFWNVQYTTDNLSGDLKNLYQDILLATQLILKVTKNLNTSTVQSDLEMLKNYTNLIVTIQKVATVNNITEELLQMMNLQKDFQCTNQTLLCLVNLTSQFLDFLQALQLPKPLMEQVLAASSIAEYWLREINPTADVYQQMVSLFELTRATLQNKPALQTILWTLTDISKIIQDMKMDNTSFPIVEDLILNIFRVLEEGNLLSSFKSPLHINSTQLENVQTQIKIIEWYMIHIKNLTENHNMSGDPYALYRLIQISLIDIMASVQNWVQFSDMSNLSSHEIKNLIQLLTTNETGNWSQLENLTHLLDILQQISSIQGLNTVDITNIWQVINKIMAGELSATQIDEIVTVLEASITAHNITEDADLQLYNFILKILTQTYSIGNMNLTQFFQSSLDSFLAMDCQGVSRMSTAVYKMILNTTNQTSPWMDEMFFSNFTLDVCTLLHWNNSQDDWLTLLQASGGLMSYVIPLVPDSMSKYVNAAEYTLVVAAGFLAEPDLTQKNIMNILNVVPAISKLFNTSAMDWVQNGTFQKLVYFLMDLAWTSSSPKDVLLIKVQNFTITMLQDMQDMLKTQPACPYNAWMTFALEVVETIINGTQDPSSEDRLLKQVWDLFKQNGMENAIISAVNDLVLNKGSVSSQDAKLLDILPQLVFNIMDSVILDTPLSLSNASTNTTIKVLQMVLSSIIQTFLPQYKNFTLQLGGLQTGMDMTTIFSELQLLLNSIITMQIPTNVSNIEANISSLISKYAQIILGSNDSQYVKLFLDAQMIFYELSQMNTTITVQQLSAIFANYLPLYVGSNNETQAYLYTILNMWQYLNNLTGALSNDLNNITVEMLPMLQSLLNEKTNVSELMSWLVNIISAHIPIAEQDRLHKVANATQHLIDTVQTCSDNSLTCPNLIEEIQNFVSDVSQLETFMQKRNLANSSVLNFGMYNQSQTTLINEIFLLLSNAMGHPYNFSSSQGGVYEDVLTLKDRIVNTTVEDNLNFTNSLSLQTIIEVINSVNITNLIHQIENILQTSTCANQTEKDAFLCKLNVALQLTQLLNQLPLGQMIHGNVSIISTILEQWIINFNTDILIYQQLIDLYNMTVITLQHQPTLQAVNTSLVGIVHMLQDMGILQNISMKETDIVSNILSEIIQQLEPGPIIYNLSSVLKYNVSELLESMQFTLDIVNWLMLHLENQTGIFANSSGANIPTVAKWIINHYQQINIIIRDIESVVNSFKPLSPSSATIDALKTLVEDLLTEFLPQTEDNHLKETLQIVLNVTRILLEVTGSNMINQIQMFISNLLTFQSVISNDPTKLFLLAMNQTGFISEIGEFIQSFIVSNNTKLLLQFLDSLKMFNNFSHMNKTITIQDLSAVLVKYLQFYSETANDVHSSLNAIFNLWQYLNNLTNGLSNDSSNTVLQMLPFLESHLLLNENTNISEIMYWLVNFLSRHVPPEELDWFKKAANASMLVIEAVEACTGKSVTCIDLTKGIENFLANVAQLETLVHNRTLANDSLLQFQSYNRSQIVLMNELFMMLSYAIEHSYNISSSQKGVYEDADAEMVWLLLREMESVNISLILTSINQLQQTIQDIKGLDLGYTFSNNKISAKVFTIIIEGMKIVNNIQAKGTIAKEDIYQIYNFTYLLVQDEQTWVPFQDISAMEAELLDVFYLAMTPFLGGNGSQAYSGNCTAQDVLQILIHTIFKNATVNESQEVTTCNCQFIYNGSDSTTSRTHTLGDMIYLALQSSPVFHTVCSKGNLQPLAEEMACLMRVIRLSMSVLAELNNMSGFQTSLIRTLNDSLTYICSNMPEHNSTFQTEIQIIKNLDAMFFNQSNTFNLLIQFIAPHYNSTFQPPVSQQAWTQISKIIKTLVPTNGSVDSHIFELIETAVNLATQPNRLKSWQNLENILSMNWTVSNIDTSLSILETMKRAVVFIDGVMDGKALQIYQAIALLVKDPTFSLLLNATSSQLVNSTMSSVAECTAIVHALANFSSSVWPIFDQSQSELLSSFGLLACNTLHIQSTNYSWASNLMIISNILSNMANYEPAEMTGYFTAIGKVISLLSEIFQSPNISQEILLNRVYELFIQELRLFSNSTIIIDWLENIPVRNLTSILFGSSNNAIFDQVLVLELDLLHLLSRSLNATSYTQGISVLSDSLMNMANSISSLTRSSGITQQLTDIMTKLIVTMQIPPLTEPYGDVINCVKYVADDLTDHQTGHLDVAIQDLFTESNELANGSMVTELLNQKIYQLKNLTGILCALDGSNNSQSHCYVPCQYLTVLQEVADMATAEIKVIQTAQIFSASTIIISLLDRIYMGIEDELDQMISSVIPVSDLLNITSLLTSFLNITNATSGDIQVPLGSLFDNSSHVEDQLRQVVKLSQPSITALMNVPFPSNKTDINGWFVTLYQCSTDPSLVAGPLQAFCNLSSVQGYQMAIIFLQNVGILQLSYRFSLPSKWQKIIEIFINALESLNEKMNDIFKNMPSQEEINFLLNIKQILNSPTNSARKKRSTDSALCSNNTNITTTPSFTDITTNLCKGNYCALSQVFSKLYEEETQSSTNRNSERAQTPDQLYGIPTDNPFCLNIFTNLVKSSNGATKWSLLKPLLYGQILYTPNTTETQKIMETTNNKLLEVQNYQKSASSLSIKIQSLLDNMKYMTFVMELVPKLEVILNNTIVEEFLQLFIQLNSTDLSANLTKATSFIPYLIAQESNIKMAQALSKTMSNLLSCMSYNRIQPLNSATKMMAKAEELQKTNEFFAAVTFDLPSSTSRKKRSASDLPKKIKYTISMRSLLSEDTSTLRNSYWTPGPYAGLNKYSRGFVYLQENIDRAIIQMQTKKSMDNVGAQYQPMPYPCYKKNSFLYSMAFTLPIALMITWVIFIASFVKKLVHEKELRLHEYMKMMGINSGSHFFAWLIECASFLIITVAILVLILKFGNILPQSNGFILFLFFLDYGLTVIAMSYFISVFFHNTNVAALSGSLVYIITFFPFIVVVSKEMNLSFAGKTLLSLFSPTALSYATQYMVRYEQQNEGIQWHNMYTSPVINDTFCFGWLCWILLIDAMIYFIVGGYIRTVFPGQYGIAAPWYFPALPSFWIKCCGLQKLFSRKPSGLMISNIVAHGLPDKKGDDLYPQNQQEPTDLNVGVSLHGLTKIYQSKAAVENLNLNFYEGHITSLLGHNGAGKTTTLSMLTGLFSASSGTIHVYGNDIRTDLEQARKDMGVCMQYDVLFDHLTTKEHLLLYGSIKAPEWDRRQLHEEVKRTLKDTGLYKHRHKPVKTLSGGMRRKLSICIALIGGSKVVILDEPTTGVDPCSRRSIWEVISKNKKEKTIILSTHHLDEAEVLSDRIAFLERGGLKCCGTPRFLKERFGSGYRLTLTKKFSNQKDEDICNTEQVTALIQSHIPEAILKEDVGGELVYVLPPFSTEISVAYLSLLRELDTSLNDLHIGCYGISDTTIEEVFLKLTDGLDENESPSPPAIRVSDKDHLMVDDESSTNSYSFFDRDDQPLTRMGHVTGFKLLLKKIMAMFIKRFHNSKRNWKGLISQILLPVLFVIAAMGLGSLSMGYVEYPELLLSPELYGGTDQAVVFGIYDKKSKDLVAAMNSFPGIDTACLDPSMQCLAANNLGSWNYTGDQTLKYGICSCSTGYTVCNAPDAVPPHRMTYSKQMMYNLTEQKMENYLLTTALQFVQRRYGGWSFGIPTSQITSFVPVSENLTLSKVWYNNEGPHSLPSFLNSFSNFLLRANLNLSVSSEYSISVYNKPLPGNVAQVATTATLVNTLVALSVLVGYSITTASFVVYVVKEYHNGSKRLQHIAGIAEVCYWLTNFLYDLAIYFIPVALSMGIIAAFKLPPFYEYPNLGAVSLLFILFGYATFSWMYLIAGTFKNPGMAFISYVCINLFIGINTIISSSVVYMLIQQKSESDKDFQSLNDTYNVLVSFFKIFPQFCFGYGLIVLSQQQAIKDQLEIYGNYEKSDIFRTDILGYMYIAMVVQGTFCFILRLLISDGIIYSLTTFIKKTCLKKYYRVPVKNLEEDEDVRAERERVDSGNAHADLLLLQGLTKNFHQVKKNLIAVNNMTLGIPPGECFGLLGVNGAGKTTTFKMLTGDISPSSGSIQLRNHFGNLVNVLGFNTDCSSFGYCPQEDALDELMTGEEHLYYYARVHGIPEKRIKLVANQLLQKLQLVQYKDRITANYSCGTRRKLSTALALIGKPSILLLDEPSSGMDPKTKRYLWKIISEEVRDKCAVILTSHSMEECEALCTRLAIMVRGKFQCIGSLQHIKSRFGSGFTVKMHLKDSSISIETITSFMHSHFPNTFLKEQHFTMAEYHVPLSAGGVSSIFDLLESNKKDLNVIHFSVSQTTLDEVFINFAQSQSSPDNSRESSQEIPQLVVAT